VTERSFNLANLNIAGQLAGLNLGGAAGAAGAASGAASAFRSNQDVVYVDVGSRRIDSNIVRDGIPIGALAVDPDVFRNVLIDRPIVLFRIVNQSVAPGTPVPQGTTVNVTLARSGNLPLGIVTGVHKDLAGLTIDQTFSRFVNPTTRRIVARLGDGPLSSTDEQAIKDTFAQQQIEITDEPGKDIDSAVQTLKTLTTFGGS